MMDPHPDIFIAGAQKAATSSLFSYLSSHPQVVGNAGQELTYYSDAAEHARGGDWAGRHYYPECPRRGCPHVHLAKNVDVLPDADAHMRAVADNPAMQVICVLRDPVRRAYSAFQWATARGLEPCATFREALERHGVSSIDGRPSHGNYLLNGHYRDQLEALTATFAPEQVQVLFYEEIVSGVGWVPGMLRALGLSDADLRIDRVVNATRKPRSKTVAKLLSRKSRVRTAVGELLSADLRVAILDSLWKVNARSAPPPPILRDDQRLLTEYFAPLDDMLADYLGRPLPWRSAVSYR